MKFILLIVLMFGITNVASAKRTQGGSVYCYSHGNLIVKVDYVSNYQQYGDGDIKIKVAGEADEIRTNLKCLYLPKGITPIQSNISKSQMKEIQ